MRVILSVLVIVFLIGLLPFNLVLGQHTHDQSVVEKQRPASLSQAIDIPFFDSQPKIDGVYDESEWSHASEVQLGFITRPFENLAPPVNTSVRVYENGTNLFVIFLASDPDPSQIRAFLRDRDGSRGEDLVGIKLDPFNDGRLAYQFFINPLGVQTDSIENEMTGNESASWNGIWESAGAITEDGFVVEVKIPLRLLNFEESDDIKKWGIEFVRFYPRTVTYRLSQVPFDRDNACGLCQMGEATGFKKAKQANNIAVVPTLVLGQNQSRDVAPRGPWDKQRNQELGLDLQWGITPEVTLSGTINPDFSQVEADAAQLNINNTFALFFSERRPFFVENADYFSSVQNLIYTRNINAPDYGAKVTGRVDNHSVGFFVANDQTTGFLVPGNLGSQVVQIEEESINLASRYRYDYSDDLSIGVIGTLRRSDSYQNLVASLDVRYRLSEQDTLRAQFSKSDTKYPAFLQNNFCDNDDCSQDTDLSEAALRTQNSDGFLGQSLRLIYNRNTNDYFINASHTKTDANFRADLGFISSVDLTKSVFGGGYFWRSDTAWWDRIRLNADWDITHNERGELTEKELEGYASIRGDYQTFIEVGTLKRDRVGLRAQGANNLSIIGNTTRFEELSNSFFLGTTPNQTFRYEFFTRIGDRVDLANNRLGDQTYLEHELSLNLGTHMRVEFEYSRSRLAADAAPLFDADLYDLRSTYQLDPRQLFRLILSYSDVKRNQSNYTFDVDSRSKDLGMQLLYSYKVNPLTKFFVGYSQGSIDNDDLTKLTVNNKSVFMKFSYAWLPNI